MSAQSAAPDPLLGQASVPLECTLTTAGARAAWVHVAGELDLSTSPRLERTLREAQVHFRAVVLDTRDVSFIDCHAVQVILSASADAEWGMPPLKLLPGRVVDDLLRLLGLHGQIWSFDPVSSECAPSEAETSRYLKLERSLIPRRTARVSAEATATPSSSVR